MNLIGNCKCGKVKVSVSAEVDAITLNPRVCDCEYCQSHPSKIISHLAMKINLSIPFSEFKIDMNGDRLAGFYRCRDCDSLVFVGCRIDGVMRGAVNSEFFPSDIEFGDILKISPKHLSANEKIKRWSDLWGIVSEAAT